VKVAMLERWEIESPGPITTRVIAQGSDLWSTCEQIEYDIFTAPDTGYFPPNNCRRIPDFDHFSRQDFIAVSRADRIVGVIRLVYAEGKRLGAGMFQTYDHRQELNIFPVRDKYLETLDARQVVDMSSMAIERRERDSRASKALINASIQRIWETGRRHILACIDTPFYRKLKGRALDFQALGPSTYCWGSPTTACILDSYSIPKGSSRVLIPYCKAKGFVEKVLGKCPSQK
jgi:N-acyl-L-homoserine lactone synthetase